MEDQNKYDDVEHSPSDSDRDQSSQERFSERGVWSSKVYYPFGTGKAPPDEESLVLEKSSLTSLSGTGVSGWNTFCLNTKHMSGNANLVGTSSKHFVGQVCGFLHRKRVLWEESMMFTTILKGISSLQRSPENGFIPVTGPMRPRTRSSVTLWHLPAEVLIHVFKESNPTLWTHTSFYSTWPTQANLTHYQKAAQHGNLEALIKLGVAYLYNEGLSGSLDEQKDIAESGRQAAHYFCQAEEQSPNVLPFTWLFIRPPWSVSGACCKACVFEAMKQQCSQTQNRNVAICVAQTFLLLGQESEALMYIQQAVERGAGEAMLMQWQILYPSLDIEKAREVEAIRELRSIANTGNMKAESVLCQCYALGKLGGISATQAYTFTRQVFQSSTPLGFLHIFSGSRDLTPSMRYILVDWLVEVASMKNFSTLTLHNAVAIVDRFLMVHDISRSKLQLLGVAAMVVSSRYLGTEIVTIREAAWLTDNTYKYEDVVRMMGEIMATLGGRIRLLTSSDFVNILAPLSRLDERGVSLLEYVCELCILQAEMAQYSPAEVAASCVLLARLLLKAGCPWPSDLEEFTGFSLEDLSRCTFHIHEKCFLEGSVVDHRSVTLQAIISYEELCNMLGVTDHILHGSDIKLKFRNTEELIVSPSRGKSRYRRTVQRPKREEASTPPLELSGYEGDHEDEADPINDLNDSFCSIRSEESQDTDMEPRTESEPDPLYMCLSASCNGGPHPGAGGIHISYTSPPLNRVSNCSCSASNTSGVGSSASPSTSSPVSKRAKCCVSNGSGADTTLPFGLSLDDSSHSEDEGVDRPSHSECKVRRKSPRTPTQMTSPNALRKKSRRRHPSQSMSY
ncbi:hypothetical protein BaRGS_00002230 [Batillaria attramentaria]|uniref:Cyclin-F n=1 Tax=Batillaria attramentaria TaxID=370345 RepID=A0ABD0M508_9CAEN